MWFLTRNTTADYLDLGQLAQGGNNASKLKLNVKTKENEIKEKKKMPQLCKLNFLLRFPYHNDDNDDDDDTADPWGGLRTCKINSIFLSA